MSDAVKSKVSEFYDLVATDYGKQYDRDQFLTLEKYPQNYFRLQLLVNRLSQCGIDNVYEVGTGEGTPLAMMAKMGFDVAGCDISQNMVDATVENLKRCGIENPDIQWGDIEDILTIANQISPPHDAAFAFGVIPHVHSVPLVLKNLRAVVGGRGKVFVEFRNKLFSLFTFNRHTHDFIMNDLLEGVSDEIKSLTSESLSKHLDMGESAAKQKNEKALTYESIKADFHNPFELEELFIKEGFENIQFHWYHYHPSMPKHEKELGEAWRRQAMDMEHESSGWRGMFLCSAGVIEADVSVESDF